MMNARGVRASGLAMIAMMLLPGCSSPPKATTRPASAGRSTLNLNTDPCATRLHDVCGPLLMYFAQHHELPKDLEDLSKVPGFEDVNDFTCPVSHQPYIYTPTGIPGKVIGTRIIIYDATPAHAGFRWGISVIEPENRTAPLVAKIIALPADFPAIQSP